MEAEHVDRLAQPGQPVVGQQRAAMVTQRGVDHVEIGEQLIRAPIRLQTQVDQVLGLAVQDLAGGGAEPAVHHPQRPAVGLVGAGRFIARAGQFQELRAGLDQPRRHRQLPFEPGQLLQVVAQRGVRGAAGGQPDHLTGDVRVAVAVSPDPRSRAQDRLLEQVRVGPATPQRVAHLAVHLGDHLEQRRGIVAQPHFDLVLNLQPRQPDQGGLPQGEDLAPQLGVDGAAVVGLVLTVQPHPHQLGDAVLGVEDGSAPGLGGVCGDHRRHQRSPQGVGHRVGAQVGGVELAVRRRQGAVGLRFTGGYVHRAAPLSVDVLGDVGQQREMAERPDHRDGPVDVYTAEQLGQLGPVDLRAPDPEGLDPGTLHQVEHLLAVLLPHGLAEDRAQQSDVLAHRLGGLPADLRAANRADRFQRHLGDLSHLPSIGGYRTARRTDEFRSSPQSPIHPQPAFPRMRDRIYVR